MMDEEALGGDGMADFLDDFGSSSDDGDLLWPAAGVANEPEPEPEPQPEPQPESEPQPVEPAASAAPEAASSATPHCLAEALVDALGRRCGAASWLGACASLAALGGPSHPVVVQFKRQGGMRLLTQLLAEPADELLDAATTAIASCSGATARPQQRTFEVSDGVAVRVQELPYETAGTGHAVWSAAVLQARWLCTHRSELAGLGSALELGSGLGLSGLTLATLGLPGLEVTLTDIVPSIVRNLLASASLNRTRAGAPLAVRACLCDWGAESDLGGTRQSAHGWYGTDTSNAGSTAGAAAQPSAAAAGPGATPADSSSTPQADRDEDEDEEDEDEDEEGVVTVGMLPPKETFDLVMAADVLYEPDHPALLAGVLHSRLRPGGRFLGVCSIRQHALLAEFVQRLEVLCVEVEVSPEDTAEMPEFAGLGCWTTQHSSTYIGGIQRISARRRPQSSLVPEEEER